MEINLAGPAVQPDHLLALADMLPIGYKAVASLERAQCLALIDWAGDALSLTPAVKITELVDVAEGAQDIFDDTDRSAMNVLYTALNQALRDSEKCFKETTALWNERHKRSTQQKAEFCAPLESAKLKIGGILHRDRLAQEQAAEEERRAAQAEADAKALAEQHERQRAAAIEKAKQDAIAKENREKQRALDEAAALAAKERSKEMMEKAARERAEFEAQKQRDADNRRAAQLAVQEAETQIVAPIIERAEIAKPSGVVMVKPVWKAKVVDATLIPREYLSINQEALDKIASTFAVTGQKIPGVAWYQTEGKIRAKGR